MLQVISHRVREVSPCTLAAQLLAWLIFIQPGEAFSQNFSDNALEFRAALSSELALNLSDDGLQKFDFTFEPEATFDLNDDIRITTIGRIRFDPVDKLEPGRPDGQEAFRSVLSRRGFIGKVGDVELREFYADASVGPAFLRLGKQQVVWGQADGLRVLDVVNPLNFREFILPDFEDRRIPLWMANVEVPVGPVMAQFLWIPDHTYNETPEPGGVYAFTSPRFAPRPPAGFSGDILLAEADRPDRFIRDDDYGLRLTGFTGGWDWSVNYFYHHDDTQALTRKALANGDIEITPEYNRTHLVGGSASNAFGKFTLRAEAGFATNKHYLTGDLNDADGVFSTDEISYVLGLDFQPDADTLLSAQIFQSVLAHRPTGAVRDRLDTTMSFLVRREFRNDTVDVELLYLQSVNDGDGLLQIDLGYDLTGEVRLVAGADIFFGDEKGQFGQFDEADRLTFGVEAGF